MENAPWLKYQRQNSDAPKSDATGDGPWKKYAAQNNNQQTASQPDADLKGLVDTTAGVSRGVGRGLAGFIGLAGDAANALAIPGDIARSRGWLPPVPADSMFAKRFPGSSDFADAVGRSGADALLEKPQTTAGKYAQTVGEMSVSAGAGPANIIKNAVLPGLATEAAREGVERGKLPSWAVPVAAVATNLAAHGAHYVAQPRNAAESVVRDALKGTQPGDIQRAEYLFNEARAAGVPITRAEALQQIAGHSRIGDVQRIVEGQGGLSDFMGQRPEKIRQANERMFDTLAEPITNPSQVGPAAGRAGESVINDTTAAINNATQPLYDAVRHQPLPREAARKLSTDEIYQATLSEIRNSPVLNSQVKTLPNNSIGVLDLVQRRMGESADNAKFPGQASTSNLAAANLQASRRNAVQLADEATGSGPGAPGGYEFARNEQSRLRDEYLSPLMAGPIGKLSRDTTTKAAIDALFPQNPTPGSAGEVIHAVKNLQNKNPWAARQLVRAHVEGTFNQATRDLQSGANEFGGASFRAKLIGNRQQAENLAAAISSLPGGRDTLEGFDRLMNVMEATGQRQRIGSQTAFNQEALANLKATSLAEESILTGMTSLPKALRERVQGWALGRNSKELSRLLTEPNAADAWKKLATAKDKKGFYLNLARLAAMAGKR